MHILLFVPDNHVTRNFVPQLWPFLLRERTPAGHEVTIIDGNARPTSEAELVAFVRERGVGLVGMGFMTRMAQRAYQIATRLRRETGVPVVFGGPHVTALPDEALGRTGLPRAADAVVLGEADEIWREVVEDAAAGRLRDVYGEEARGGKPALNDYKAIDWERFDLALFDLMRFVPGRVRRLMRGIGIPYEKAYVVPLETSRGCPYGCEFCTVTGFFGQDLRFRSNDSVIDELLSLKRRAAAERALITVFFIDDNLAIRRDRLKSLLRDMIRADACLPWVGQISVNLLEDEELVELIGLSGGRFVFMGLESVDPQSLKSARKAFNKPENYGRTLERLARHDVYAVTSFIVGLDGDHPGTARRLARAVDSWPPVLPVFGLLTPYPATPLYDRLRDEGRLVRPQHWLDFQAFKAAFQPAHLSSDQAEQEVREAWRRCYGRRAFKRSQQWLAANGKSFDAQVMLFVARLLFRGIYFPQMTAGAWIRVLAANSITLARLVFRQVLLPSPVDGRASRAARALTPNAAEPKL